MSDYVSPRQMEILNMIAAGAKEQQIATALGIAINTVKRHKGYMFQKHGARSSAHMVAIAFRAGVLK